MPKKNDRRRGRRTRTLVTTSSTSSSSSASSSQAAQVGNSAKTNPASARGRTTKNSRQGRKPPRVQQPKKSAPSAPRRISPRNRPPHYKSETGEVYKPGDFAYVDSQQPDLPYHICSILNFKMIRKDSLVAEVKWYYRVSELPEALYELLLGDRKNGENFEAFQHPKIKERELFLAFNKDTHPASLLRGKCHVKQFSEIPKLSDFLAKEDCFFYEYGYKPEWRRLTMMDESSFVPHSQQAVLPECTTPVFSVNSSPISDKSSVDGSSQPESKTRTQEERVWKPGITDEGLLMYIRIARSIALHAGICINGIMRDGCLAASSDETTQHAFDVLHQNSYDTDKALQTLVKKPIVGQLHRKKNWSKEHSVLFAKGMRQFGKNFNKIKNELLPMKTVPELIEYYYYWKKTTAGLSSRNTRKQRKQSHIRMSKPLLKPKEDTPEREYIDLSSADEEDQDDDNEKCQSFYACRHCFAKESPSWHHAGTQKAILCHVCRLHYQRYGHMRLLTNKREPPKFMFKDYHESLQMEEVGRRTRNSNGIRISSRAGLRNGKVLNKSDSDDDGDVTDSTESTSGSCSSEIPPPPINNPKALQSRRSLLELMQAEKKEREGPEEDLPSAKRQKLDKEQEVNDTCDEDESTTNGDGEGDADAEGEADRGSQKSSEEPKSASQSPTSSSQSGDEERNPPRPISITSSHSLIPTTSTVEAVPAPLEEATSQTPEHFKRVSQDKESTCARTDLIHIPLTREERNSIAAPKKVHPLVTSTSTQSSVPDHGHASASTPTHQTKRVPIITPHEPHLPSGPAPQLFGLPILPHHPMTPLGPSGPFPGMDPSSMMAAAMAGFPPPPQIPGLMPPPGIPTPNDQEKEAQAVLLLQQQQQQQQHHLQMALQKQLLEAQAHHVIPSAHLPSGVPLPHPSADPMQGLVFKFPSTEDMARAQQHQQLVQMALTEGMQVLPHGFHLTPGGADVIRQHSEEANHPRVPHLTGPYPPPFMAIPPGLHSLEAIQQQQQALLAQHQPPAQQPIPMMPENIGEFMQQAELVLQQVHKDPGLLHQPQVQLIMAQYQQLQDYNAAFHHQQQQLALLQQQEILKHQQQQAATAVSKFPGTMRPGVIMNMQSK